MVLREKLRNARSLTMCNLYNVATNTEAMRQFTRALRDMSGFNEPSRDVYPGTWHQLSGSEQMGNERSHH